MQTEARIQGTPSRSTSGGMFAVGKCATWIVPGTRATWSTRAERPGNMGSGVQRVDKGILAACSAVDARHRRLDVAPRCIPSIPYLIP